MRGHIIVCGDDALAMQIIDELNDAEISVVPLKSPKALNSADVATARAVIAASPDDALNLEVALLARRANPHVRVVARIANTSLREAMDDPDDPGDMLDVADLAAPSVVEALLGRTAHTIHVGEVDFVVSGAIAPVNGTLREIYGRLAPVAIIRGPNSADAGDVIPCPSLDAEVRQGDWTSMIGRPEELSAQGMRVGRTGDITAPRRPALWRLMDTVRAFSDDIHPTFYRALAVLAGLLIGSTIVLRFNFRSPGMSWMDALYFSTETLATVGYGDFNFMPDTVVNVTAVAVAVGCGDDARRSGHHRYRSGVRRRCAALPTAFTSDQPPACASYASPFRGHRPGVVRDPGGEHAQGGRLFGGGDRT